MIVQFRQINLATTKKISIEKCIKLRIHSGVSKKKSGKKGSCFM